MQFGFTMFDASGRPRATVEAKRRMGAALGGFASGQQYIQARRRQAS